jgi:hypothetical protein
LIEIAGATTRVGRGADAKTFMAVRRALKLTRDRAKGLGLGKVATRLSTFATAP